MKKVIHLMAIWLLLLPSISFAEFVSGSTGADGAFSPTANIQLQLPADGVFNFTTVYIPSNVTVTFVRNSNNTPVYILATGNVNIAGQIKVDASNAATGFSGAAGGPGGFNGGYGYYGTTYTSGGKGLGSGGGNPSSVYDCSAGSGSFGTTGANGGTCGATSGSQYGNTELQPFIGGSGGGGQRYGGGGGGGAILIASSGVTNLTGTISANGGDGAGYPYYCYTMCNYAYGGSGSGGAIRLIANTISGSGYLYAKGGGGSSGNPVGGLGRIRIEANTRNFTFTTSPSFSYDMPSNVFLANTPALMITSISGVAVPASPAGSYATPDILLPKTTTNPVPVTISAAYIPLDTTVTVSLIPQYGSATNVTTILNGTLESSTGSVSLNLPTQNYISIIQAHATFSVQTAMYYEGEKIDKVRVAANMGQDSEAVYITESGREIPYGTVMASLMK